MLLRLCGRVQHRQPRIGKMAISTLRQQFWRANRLPVAHADPGLSDGQNAGLQGLSISFRLFKSQHFPAGYRARVWSKRNKRIRRVACLAQLPTGIRGKHRLRMDDHSRAA